MLPPLFPGHRVPQKWVLHNCLEMLPEGKPWLCSPSAHFLCVWMDEQQTCRRHGSAPDQRGEKHQQGLPRPFPKPTWGRLGAVPRPSWCKAGCWSTKHLSDLHPRDLQTGPISARASAGPRSQLTAPSSLLVSFPCSPEPARFQPESFPHTNGDKGGGLGTYKNCFFPAQLERGAMEF